MGLVDSYINIPFMDHLEHAETLSIHMKRCWTYYISTSETYSLYTSDEISIWWKYESKQINVNVEAVLQGFVISVGWETSFKKTGPVPLAIKGWIAHIFRSDFSTRWQLNQPCARRGNLWNRCHISEPPPHWTVPLLQPANRMPQGIIGLLTF